MYSCQQKQHLVNDRIGLTHRIHSRLLEFGAARCEVIWLSTLVALLAVGRTLAFAHGMFSATEQAGLVRLTVRLASLTESRLMFGGGSLDKFRSRPSSMPFHSVDLYGVVWRLTSDALHVAFSCFFPAAQVNSLAQGKFLFTQGAFSQGIVSDSTDDSVSQ